MSVIRKRSAQMSGLTAWRGSGAVEVQKVAKVPGTFVEGRPQSGDVTQSGALADPPKSLQISIDFGGFWWILADSARF